MFLEYLYQLKIVASSESFLLHFAPQLNKDIGKAAQVQPGLNQLLPLELKIVLKIVRFLTLF